MQFFVDIINFLVHAKVYFWCFYCILYQLLVFLWTIEYNVYTK